MAGGLFTSHWASHTSSCVRCLTEAVDGVGAAVARAGEAAGGLCEEIEQQLKKVVEAALVEVVPHAQIVMKIAMMKIALGKIEMK